MGQTHRVQQGEHLTRVALQYGFRRADTVWNDPQNADLRKRRKPDILFPGDELYVPDKKQKSESKATGQTYTFRIPNPSLKLRIVLKEDDGQAAANEVYRLQIGETLFDGTTDGSGVLEQIIPADAEDGELILEKRHVKWPLRIGHLDPLSDEGSEPAFPSGVQARLSNLGWAADVTGQMDERTKGAIARFQKAGMKRKEPDGVADKDTRDALRGEHGC